VIVNRPAGSTWEFLGVNGAPGLVTNEQVSLGYGLGDISEHGPPNYGVRGAASGFLFGLFGGFTTWQLQSIAVGGTFVRRMRTNLLTTSTGVSYQVRDTPWTFSAAPPTIGPTVNVGIGEAVNIFSFDMDNVSIGLPGAPGVVFIPPEYTLDIDVFLPPGHAIVFQSLGTMTGNLAVEWTEFPA
jgi:hypothetical protein